jgi:hypothetical protein
MQVDDAPFNPGKLSSPHANTRHYRDTGTFAHFFAKLAVSHLFCGKFDFHSKPRTVILPENRFKDIANYTYLLDCP